MKLSDYIRGQRKGKEAHRLEKEAMKDSFLADAMDGYQMVEGSHEERLNTLHRQIASRAARKRNHAIVWSVAASLLIGISISGYFLFQKDTLTDKNYAEEKATDMLLEEELIPIEPQQPDAMAKVTPKDTTKNLISENKKIKRTTPLTAVPTPQADIAYVQETENEEAVKENIADTTVAPNVEYSNAIRGAVAMRAMSKAAAPGEVKELSKNDTVPEPVIGMKEYKKYLKEKLIRPTDNDCAGIKGKVTITFFVNENGRPCNLSIEKGLCPSADKEAIRLIEEGPDWTHGSKRVSVTIKF